MTPTNLKLATHYKLNKDTVQKWKKTRPEVYKALVNEYCRTNIVINNKVRYAKFIEDGRSIVSDMLKDSISHVVRQKLEEDTTIATNDTDSYLSKSDIKAYLSEDCKIEVSECALKKAKAIISEFENK